MDAKEKYKSRKPYIVRKTVGWHYDKEKRQTGSGNDNNWIYCNQS